MVCKIGVIWSSEINDKEKYPDNVIIYDKVKMSEAAFFLQKLIAENVEAIVATVGISHALDAASSPPVIIGYPQYIDVLETLRYIEQDLSIVGKKIAIILHKDNPFLINKVTPFSNNHLTHLTFENVKEIDGIIENIVKAGYFGTIAGPTASALALKYGIEAFPLPFGSSIIDTAINVAKTVVTNTRKERLLVQQLETVINISQDGMLITDTEDIINMCNPKALKVLECENAKLAGVPLNRVLASFKMSEHLKDKETYTEELAEYKGNKFFVTKQSIIINRRVIGHVVRLQETSKIQNLEQRFRLLQNMGLVAKYHFEDIIYKCEKMHTAVEMAKISAGFDFTVLIYGETGTGKELFAQSIHNASSRRIGPFVAINCAALAENLLESELMGYEEGAFTGAKKGGKIGLFERAHKGTIFLDEINQMSMTLQAKVLRVIQEKAVMRIGGERVIPIDVRIITATNENLTEKIEKKLFRSDLYYRINVINIELPPLRQRAEDIPMLVEYFISKVKDKYPNLAVNRSLLLNSMEGCTWKGNIRELENYIIRVCVMAKDLKISLVNPEKEDIMGQDTVMCGSEDRIAVKVGTLEEMEKVLISEVVLRCRGNKTKAAAILDMSRNTIQSKLKE
jgi:transcriptional regulator with PAS, ATPase and Fis domain